MGAPVAIGAAIVGTGLQLYGQKKSRDAVKKQELENIALLEKQNKFAQQAVQRETEIFYEEGQQLIGNQASTFAANGVDISGSALMTLIDTEINIDNEIADIKQQAKNEGVIALDRINASRSRLREMNSFSNKYLPYASTILGGVSQIASAQNKYGSDK